MDDSSGYALGYTDAEHERLARQARRLGPFTERLLREAGVREGLRVLDFGSGIGDVTMLVAQLVGPSGDVVGVERDARSVERARARAAAAGFTTIAFIASDVTSLGNIGTFDAIVGRFILQFLPDPVAALRSASTLLRPGGIVAFQEVAWAPARAANDHLPLWSACASVVHEAIRRTGANTDSGLALHRIFHEAGLPEPQMTFDMKMDASRELLRWPYDLLRSVGGGHAIVPDRSLESLGDLDTLLDRLEAEVRSARSAVTSIGVVGAWSRLPERSEDRSV